MTTSNSIASLGGSSASVLAILASILVLARGA
jgi:hypothetical protein